MAKSASTTNDTFAVGWREWVSLPDLGIPAIKAKLDTGARTSSLHTYFIEPYEVDGIQMVRFGVHPLQRRDDVVVVCRSRVLDRRWTTDTGGRREKRYIIGAVLSVGGVQWPIEVNLTNREDLRFRFLVGRTAMKGRMVVDPARSYLKGKKPVRPYSAGEKRKGE